jgi:hypothetical protein
MSHDSAATEAAQLGCFEQPAERAAGASDAPAAAAPASASLLSQALTSVGSVALAGLGALTFASRSWTQGLRSHAEALEETRDEMADDCGDEAEWYKKEPAQTAAQL